MNNVMRMIGVLSLGVLLSFSFLKEKKVVVIDAGHGGKDLGINRDGFVEKNVVLQVAKKIKELNRNQDLEIILTRDDDSYPALSERTDLVNKINPDLTISLHINSSPKANSEKKGAEIFYKDNEASKVLADKLATKFNNCPVKTEKLHMLRMSNNPSLLLELGFANQKDEREYLASDKGQTETAEKILSFLNEN